MLKFEQAPIEKVKGRPTLERVGLTIEALKPWKDMRMSRSSWYRRQKAMKAGLKKDD